MAETILDVNMGNDDDYTFELIPDGTELTAKVETCFINVDDDDPLLKKIRIRLSSVDNPDTQYIEAFPIVIPNASSSAAVDKRQFAITRDRFKTFCQCFNIDYSMGLNTETIKGALGKVIVSVVDDPQRGRVNQVKQYIVGQK